MLTLLVILSVIIYRINGYHLSHPSKSQTFLVKSLHQRNFKYDYFSSIIHQSNSNLNDQPSINILNYNKAFKKNRLLEVFDYPKRKFNNIRLFFQTQLPMLQYLWPKDDIRLRIYLVISMFFMFLGKWFNLKVPFIFKSAIDNIPTNLNNSFSFTSPIALALVYYGLSRALSVVCSEIKTFLFTHVSQNVLRKFANQIFQHLHSLDSEFHLQTPSGVVSVAYVRAVRGFQTLMFQIVFSVAPTFLELVMVSNILYKKFSPIFAMITLATFSIYLFFTVMVTQWRVALRQQLVDVDNARNGFFIDSILNHEVVKLFTNEKKELARFDEYLQRIQQISIDSTFSIAILNFGQAALFCAGLTTSLLIALQKVQAGTMSVGDLVAVNSMLLQLAIPFNFMGYTYQELRQSFVDMGYMRGVLNQMDNADASIQGLNASTTSSITITTTATSVILPTVSAVSMISDTVTASNNINNSNNNINNISINLINPAAADVVVAIIPNITVMINQSSSYSQISPSSIEFRNVSFNYKPRVYHNKFNLDNQSSIPNNSIIQASSAAIATNNTTNSIIVNPIVLLRNVSFTILPGENVAIVGPSGSGKSTTLKLITRMLYPESGDILIDGMSIFNMTVETLRGKVSVVPQDTSLFDESVLYNIRYGNQQASMSEVHTVVQQSNLELTISKLPQGFNTLVGERGARLSGGERQKVSIARALLRNPSLILCDEVTSSVDAFAEREIIDTLRNASASRTTITVAHRLSSIVHCDRIIVLQDGLVIEQGKHNELLKISDGVYSKMWNAQNGLVMSCEG